MAFRFECGHCGVASIGRVAGHIIKGISTTDWRPYCLVNCDNCGRGNLLSFNINSGYETEFRDFEKHGVVIEFDDLREKQLYPVRRENVPDYLPDLLHGSFSDAEFNFSSKRWKAAAQMYLQSLEFACVSLEVNGDEAQALIESEKKVDLTKRINSLFESGKISGNLKEWAHQIRIIGQFHKHRYIDASDDDCSDIRDFVDMFLRYTFTVPGQIANRRERQRLVEKQA